MVTSVSPQVSSPLINFQDFSDEIIVRIFLELDFSSLLNAQAVCLRLKNITGDDIFSDVKFSGRFPDSYKYLELKPNENLYQHYLDIEKNLTRRIVTTKIFVMGQMLLHGARQAAYKDKIFVVNNRQELCYFDYQDKSRRGL